MSLPAITVEVTLPITSIAADALPVLDALQAAGATHLEMHEGAAPIRVFGGFAAGALDTVEQHAREALQVLVPGGERMDVAVRAARRLDWDSTWEGVVRPLWVDPLWIIPPGARAPATAGPRVELARVDAFGTGHHATTLLLLERLAELPMPTRVLDVGTGSGILALSALALGARTAVATDHDPRALAVARRNALHNRVVRRLRFSSAAPDQLGQRFPLVVANILASTLVELAPSLARSLAPGGCLLLGGVTDTQAEDVARAFAHHGLLRGPDVNRDGWTRLEFMASW